MPAKRVEAHAPWIPPGYAPSVVWAMKALAEGKASENQQKLLLNWIINDLCGTYDLPFRPEGDRETVFASAKQFVGQQIVKLIKIDPKVIKEDTPNERR